MNSDSRLTLGWPAAIGVVLLMLILGGGVTYLMLRPSVQRTPSTASHAESGTAPPAAGTMAPSGGPSTVPGSTSTDVVVTLSQEALQRAGIVVASAQPAAGQSTLRLPAVIQSNAYKEVSVTPLVPGRVTRVLVELGQKVRRGQPLAEIFSPELAEAETRYVSMRAELDAHERELQRTEKLVEIGAASRQELERLHAEHAAKLTAVESTRSRLELLGVSSSAIASLGHGKDVGATTTVTAPIAGVVTARAANAGLNVDPGAKLFTVVDLSTVWVVADAYEKDFSRVQAGSSAAVTTTAYPDVTLRGRVTYIDPQVNPETRTAKVRIEVANPGERLRLGMFADVSIESSGSPSGARIPKSAIQNVADRTVVYLADSKQPGRFVERDVRLGDAVGDEMNVLSGIQPGDSIVSDGSFFVRAERERLGVRAAGPAPAATNRAGPPPQTNSGNSAEVKVLVTEQGYEPAKVMIRAGTRSKITFIRTTEKTCGKEVVFPSLNVRRALPLNQPVTIELAPNASGEIGFVCGVNMLQGTVVVHEQ
jgi:membrane fusion protein, heavy metal efflux system